MTPEELERFMSHVDIVDGHWLWKGGKYVTGYGLWKSKYAHRVSLEHKLGRPLTPGLIVCHLPVVCHIRHCVNPDHLREDTIRNNRLDTILDGTNVRSSIKAIHIPGIRADQRPYPQIAAEYDVTPEAIGNIKNRKSWKHIE